MVIKFSQCICFALLGKTVQSYSFYPKPCCVTRGSVLPISSGTRSSSTELYYGTNPFDVTDNSQQEQRQQQRRRHIDPSSMRVKDIKAELNMYGITYADLFEKESLVERLVEARANNNAAATINTKWSQQQQQQQKPTPAADHEGPGSINMTEEEFWASQAAATAAASVNVNGGFAVRPKDEFWTRVTAKVKRQSNTQGPGTTNLMQDWASPVTGGNGRGMSNLQPPPRSPSSTTSEQEFWATQATRGNARDWHSDPSPASGVIPHQEVWASQQTAAARNEGKNRVYQQTQTQTQGAINNSEEDFWARATAKIGENNNHGFGGDELSGGIAPDSLL